MHKKAVFLDRDGTINVDKRYLYKREDFEYLPGAIDGLRMIQDAGFTLIIITNQSGIARGYYKEEDYKILEEWMKADLKCKGITISATYYCPHHSDAIINQYKTECRCRKPKTALFYKAARENGIDVNLSFAIGDRLRDSEGICKETSCQGFLIGETEEKWVIDSVKGQEYKNLRYKKTLYDAARSITEDFRKIQETENGIFDDFFSG